MQATYSHISKDVLVDTVKAVTLVDKLTDGIVGVALGSIAGWLASSKILNMLSLVGAVAVVVAILTAILFDAGRCYIRAHRTLVVHESAVEIAFDNGTRQALEEMQK